MRHPVLALLLAALSAAAPLMSDAAGPRRPVAPASDVTPPTLTFIGLPKSVNLGTYGSTLVVDIKARDDGEGVWNVWPTLVGPSGQVLELGGMPFWGDPAIDTQVGYFLPVTTEPGAWTIGSVRVCDAVMNCSSLDAAALTAVGGRHRVTAKNPAYDAVAPTLTAGELSRYYRGGMPPPYLIAHLTMQDTGTLGLAGVYGGEIELCLADNSGCTNAWGSTFVPGLANTTVVMANQVPDRLPQGQYWVKSVRVSDQNGNQRLYTSTLFGGETDFTQIFPQPWLNLP